MDDNNWEFLDAYLTFLERDSAREQVRPVVSEQPVVQSHGDHPPAGQYVVDPDYMELLGLDPDQLFRNFK